MTNPTPKRLTPERLAEIRHGLDRTERLGEREELLSHIAALKEENKRLQEEVEAGRRALPDLIQCLRDYAGTYPAFRSKPVGAPGSPARMEQDFQIDLEARSKAAIDAAMGTKQGRPSDA